MKENAGVLEQTSEDEKEEKIVWLDVDRVRRMPDQPREYFNPKALKELAESIKIQKQIQPILVKNGGNGFYDIVDGERRWRACRLAGKKRIKAIIKDVLKADDHFIMSAIANFGRENHTILEEMKSILRFIKIMVNDPTRTEEQKKMGEIIPFIAKCFAKSEPWVYSRLRLVDLNPEVKRMLDPTLPKHQRLPATVGLELAKIKNHREQLQMMLRIFNDKMKTEEAKHFIQKQAKTKGLEYGERKRKPSDDLRVFQGFLNRTNGYLERLIDTCQNNGAAKKMFNQKTEDKKRVIREVRSCSEKFSELADILKN